MANTRLSMRRIKEVLRLHFEQNRSRRLIAQTVGASPTTVGDYIARAQAAGLTYPQWAVLGDRQQASSPPIF